MKKFKNFILSLIIPHRMVRFKDMSVLIAIFLLLISFILGVFSNNSRMNAFVDNEIYNGNYEEIIDDKVGINEVSVDINKDGIAKIDLPSSSNGVYKKTLKSTDTTYEVTFVFGDIKKDDSQASDDKKDENDANDPYQNIYLNNFNLHDYVYYNRANRKENTTYLLYIFLETNIVHLYDLGQVNKNNELVETGGLFRYTETVVNENAGMFKTLLGSGSSVEVSYYLPKDESELIKSSYDENNYNYNVSSWTEKANKDATKDIEINGQTITLKAMPKFGRTSGETTYDGINYSLSEAVSYTNLLDSSGYTGFKLDSYKTSLKDFIVKYHESNVFVITDTYKVILFFIAFLIFIIIPLVFSLFVWLFTRKRGLTNYKAYLNIISIITLYLALIFFIVGWFINLLNMSLIIFVGVLMMLWYYIFVIYQITTRIEKENDENNHDQNIPKKEEPKKPEFKKIDDNYSVIG